MIRMILQRQATLCLNQRWFVYREKYTPYTPGESEFLGIESCSHATVGCLLDTSPFPRGNEQKRQAGCMLLSLFFFPLLSGRC